MNWQHIQAIIRRHRLVYAIAGSIGMSLLLTIISITLYNSSGASQLDLSRPGYEKVRSQVIAKDNITFSADGPVNTTTINQFKDLLNQQNSTLQHIDNFKSDVMSDSQLRLDVGSQTDTGE